MNPIKSWKPILLFCLALLACNLPTPTGGSNAGSTQAATLPPVATEGVQPSGLPILVMQAGTGYLFETGQAVSGPDPRDLWWNGVSFVPGTLMTSLGVMDSPSSIDQIKPSLFTFGSFDPAPGEAFVVEVSSGAAYAIIRYLARGDQAEITIEYLYPYAGQVLP